MGAEVDLRAQMEKERAAALFGQGLFPTVSNAVIGAIVALAMAPAVGRRGALVWFAAMLFVTAARALLWIWHRLRPQAMAARGWLLTFTIGGTINGLTWGAIALSMWPPDAAHRALVAFVVGGMVASSTAVVPAFLPAFYTFAAGALLVPIVRLLVEGGTVNRTMGLLLTTFGLAMGKLARGAGRWFAQNTELRLSNAALVASLSEARDQLERRVKERTRELEQTLALVREAEGRAQAALRDRDEFLAVASHELRTPIATLELHLSRLVDPAAPDAAASSASLPLMHRQLRRLTGLVDTVLTASGLVRAQPEPDPPGELDLGATVRAVVEDLTSHASRLPPIHFDLDEPTFGRWPVGRVEQVISNLVSNALKYGGGTPVRIGLEAVESDVVLTVADGGPGISDADQAHVFDRFYRADVAARPGGLGLGLAVVRELVHAMGGTVGVSSAPGQGAIFTVRLPRLPRRS